MKKYLLLRDNAQSGPYALEDLRRLTLKPLDLIWIEGVSTRWHPVSECRELQDFIVKPARRPVVNFVSVSRRPAVPAAEIPAPTPVDGFGEKVRRQPRKFHFRPMPRAGSPTWILGLFICLIGGTVVVEKILETPQAEGIMPEKMAAQPLPAVPEEQSVARPADIDYQNAIKKETITPDSVAKPISAASLKSLRRQVIIGTNKLRTGIFGGIDDLQVKVYNGSGQLLDKVNLLVQFFRPNGTPLREERYSIYSVKPHSEKILVVPPGKRGVRVKYKLIGVETKEEVPELTTA
jgi:hypothetical protein